ncbi:MAG TPA: prolyl oligopeptidase family serine peptidase [Thermoanaerobaculia bacterium]|nr:prolyl oligopeptidase family serine peptidase [Thermoanaerobaculia bacterium]
MNRIALSVLLLSTLAAASPLAAQPHPAHAASTLPVPDSLVVQNVPPLHPLADLLPYENIRTASFADWHPKERRMLIRTRFANTVQLHEVAMPLGARTQVTFLSERVDEGRYRPGHPDQVVFGSDVGGSENYQIYLLDRTTGRSRTLSDGTHRYLDPRWSHDGKLLVYTSNLRNGRDSDIYVADPDTAGSERRLLQVNGNWAPLDWSPDDRRILLGEYVSANEAYLHWVDVATGKVHAITPRVTSGPTVLYQGGHWAKDGRSVYTTSDRDAEFRRLVRLDVDGGPGGAAGKATVLSGAIPWGVEDFDLSEDGALLAFFTNEDGFSKLHALKAADGVAVRVPDLPAGVAGGISFRPGSHEVAFQVSWARSPADIYSFDPDSGRLDRWTASEAGGLPTASLAVPELVRYPTFDRGENGAPRTIPAFIYRPPADRFPGKRPVYVDIHGGPEAQTRPGFLGSNNYMISELGVVLIQPNVRGSEGYGKTYLKLDNGEKREDTVKDIGALLDWIGKQPDLDASRVMVGGGSYGGYMSLAVLVHYSDRLRCGYEVVGISNFVTFLKNTQEYRRDLRRVEYGDERDPKMAAFLESIAPARHADKITKPLLVAQGANDPRVPLSESDNIVKEVASKGVPTWYVVAKNEGHGFQKKENVDYLRQVLLEFMRRYLLGNGTEGAAAGR